MTVLKPALGLLLAGLLMANTAHGQIYKWVDDDGVAHYSDQPLKEGAVRSEIQSSRTDDAGAADRLAAAQKLRDDQSQAFYARRNGDQQGTAPELTPEQKEFHRKSCEAARNKMNEFAQARRLYKITDTGEKAYLTEDEILAARTEVQRAIGEHCK